MLAGGSQARVGEGRHRHRQPAGVARQAAAVGLVVVERGVEEGLVTGVARGERQRGRGVHDERGERGLHAPQTRDVAGREGLRPDQFLHGLPGIRVGEHQRRIDALTMLEHDATGAPVLDPNPPHGALEEDLSSVAEDRGRQRVGEALEAAAAVEGALRQVAHQHVGEVEEGDARGRQAEVGPERPHQRPQLGRLELGIQHLGQGGAAIAQQGREAPRVRDRAERARQLRSAPGLLADVQALLEELAERLGLRGIPLAVDLDELLDRRRARAGTRPG